MQKKKGIILVIEDDRVDQMAFERFVRTSDFPYDYQVAESIAAARDMLGSNQYDAVLMDFMLGDGTAFDIIDKVKEMPFILITGSSNVELAVKAMKRGAYDFLTKDAEGAYLKALPFTIKNAINHKLVEDELKKYREHLEELVEERTKALKIEINERRKANQAFKESEEKFRSVVENSHDSILIIDNNFEIVYANNEVLRLFGSSWEEVIGQDFRHFLPSESKELVAKRYVQRQRGEKVTDQYRFFISRKSGEKRYVELIASIIKSQGGEVHTVAHLLDITEQKQLEEQLIQSQKMEAVGRLAGGIAHDFNNLLTAITGYSDILLKKLENQENLRKDVEIVKRSAEQAANLTRQLLLFSRKQTIKPEILDINSIVTNIQKILHRIIGEDIKLETNLEAVTGMLKADPGQIEQVLMNLVINSRDAMPGGGKLIVSTSKVTVTEADCVGIPESYPGEFIKISVEDNGQGMDMNKQQHIFEPFYTTKKEGTGLGLSVVYGITKRHKGWIEVKSEIDVGTVFDVFLPRYVSKEKEIRKDNSVLKGYTGNNERILLVEDEESVRKLVGRILTDGGYQVIYAGTVEEALDVFSKEKMDFDLLLSDVVLPDKSGLDLVDEIHSQKPDLRVILSSGYTDSKSQWPIIKKRGYPFLQKPYSVVDLLKEVRKAISRNEE